MSETVNPSKNPFARFSYTGPRYVSEYVIIMPVHNALEYVKRSLGQIDSQYPDAPVVIVDDCSNIETKTFLNSPECRRANRSIISNSSQQLFTRTVNRGLRFAKGIFLSEYYIVVNSDCDLLDGWLDSMLAIAREESNIGLIGYRDSPDPNVTEPYSEVFTPGYVTGHCLLLRHEALLKTGLLCETDLGGPNTRFPEFAGLHGTAHIGSDRALSNDMQNNGYRTVYCNAPFIHHEAGKSWHHSLHWLANFQLDPLWEPSNTF